MRPALKPKRNIASMPPIAAPANKSTSLEFWTEHPSKPAKVNLIEFVTGVSKTHPHWGGDFTGRPGLIEELAPHIYMMYRARPEQSCSNLINTLRFWWRLFDEFEAVAPVRTVADINHFYEAAQIRKNAAAGRTNAFLALVNARRLEAGLGRLFWIKKESNTTQTTLVEHGQIKLVYEELKQRAWHALEKINSTRKLEGINRYDEIAGNRIKATDWSFADKVATHKYVCSQIGHPCPPQRRIQRVSWSMGEWCAEINRKTFYSLEDIQAFFFLTLLLTGWNAETALDIDLEKNPVIPHPTSSAFLLLRSIKTRGNTEQIAICQAKRELSPANLVLEVVRATQPLREHLRRVLRELPPDADRKHRTELERAIRSVWIYPVRGGVIRRLVASDATRTLTGEDGVSLDYLPRLVKTINSRICDPKAKLISEISTRHLRDSFISFAYANYGYSWLIAKLAAGHSDLNTTRTYLNKTHWARFGQSKVRKLTEALWKEIGARRIVEPAFLFAMVQRGEISEIQRERWLNYRDRTRLGVGCKDFKNPPKVLVPEHRDGAGCRAFRCTLCPHAVIFPDSLDHLARRAAELHWVRANIPLVTWEQSIFPEEERSLEDALQLFPERDVKSSINTWKHKITCGAHSPLLQEGEYE